MDADTAGGGGGPAPRTLIEMNPLDLFEVYRRLDLACTAHRCTKERGSEPLYNRKERWVLIEDAIEILAKMVCELGHAILKSKNVNDATDCGQDSCPVCAMARAVLKSRV